MSYQLQITSTAELCLPRQHSILPNIPKGWHTQAAHICPRGSPSDTLDNMSVTSRSVPATPLGGNGAASHLKTPGTPYTPDTQGFGTCVSSQGPLQSHENPVKAGDLQASLSRLPPGQYDKGLSPFKLAQAGHDESLQVNILRTFLGVFY